jgi:hypothetical protein
MLLANNGSTTVLLEAIADAPLSVLVHYQGPARDSDRDQLAVRRILGVSSSTPIMERHSTLVTPDREVVSSNRVHVALGPGQPPLPDPRARTPLGHRIQEQGALQRREIVEAGVTTWPEENLRPAPSAFKLYKLFKLESLDVFTMLIREVFSPQIAPVPEAVLVRR